jgi:hypothetical protein
MLRGRLCERSQFGGKGKMAEFPPLFSIGFGQYAQIHCLEIR